MSRVSSSGSITSLWSGVGWTQCGVDPPLSSLMQWLAGACSSQAVGLRVLVAHSCPLKATLWSLFHGAVFRTAHNVASVFIKERCKKKPKRVPARQKSQSYNLVSKVRCHHFCCIIFVGCESLVPAHIRGRGSHR